MLWQLAERLPRRLVLRGGRVLETIQRDALNWLQTSGGSAPPVEFNTLETMEELVSAINENRTWLHAEDLSAEERKVRAHALSELRRKLAARLTLAEEPSTDSVK